MDSTLKQRLIGAAVLAALAVIFLPMLLKGPDVKEPDAAEVPLSMPATPGQEFETRELPLTEPDGATPPGGVLGMATAPENGSANPDLSSLPTQADTLAEPQVPTPDAVAVATTPAALSSSKPEPVPAVPAALPAPSVAAGNYSVSVGSFSNLDSANALVAKLRAAKLPVSSERVTLASGTAVRVRVGPYADQASAEAARLRTESVTGGIAKVIVLDAIPSAPEASKVAAPAANKTLPASAPAAAAVATTAPAATPSAAKPAVASAGFAVQLSAPSVEADALALRDRARAAGFASFVQRIETDSGPRFRVRIGPVADRSDAAALLDAANTKLGIKGIVVANP